MQIKRGGNQHLRDGSFNSLFEMRTYYFGDILLYVVLSILYLRCAPLSQILFTDIYFAFNSLFEMLSQVAMRRISTGVAFNSLFEMPNGW